MALIGFDGHELTKAGSGPHQPRYYAGGVSTNEVVANPYPHGGGQYSLRMKENDLYQSTTLPFNPSNDVWVCRAMKLNSLETTVPTEHDEIIWFYMGDPSTSGAAKYAIELDYNEDSAGVNPKHLRRIALLSAAGYTLASEFAGYTLENAGTSTADWFWLMVKFQVESPFGVEVWLDGLGGVGFGNPTKVIGWAGNAGTTGSADAGCTTTKILGKGVAWDNDEWNKLHIRFTSGVNNGVSMLITDTVDDPGGDYVTCEAFPNAPAEDDTFAIEVVKEIQPPTWANVDSFQDKIDKFELDVDNFFYLDVSGSAPYNDKLPYDHQISGYQPYANACGWEEWTPNDEAEHYANVDDFNRDGLYGNDDHLSITNAETGKELFSLPEMGGSDDPSAVIIVAELTGLGGTDPPDKHVAWVDGEDKSEYAPSYMGGGLGGAFPSQEGKLWLLTPDGNAWTKARVDDLYIGFRQDETGTARAVRWMGAEIAGAVVTQPAQSADPDRGAVVGPGGEPCVVAMRRIRGLVV